MTTYSNTIDVDANGNSTVYGDIAHKVFNYGRGEYPRTVQGYNRFFVIEHLNGKNIVRAAQPTMNTALEYVHEDSVLVCVAEDNRPSFKDGMRE